MDTSYWHQIDGSNEHRHTGLLLLSLRIKRSFEPKPIRLFLKSYPYLLLALFVYFHDHQRCCIWSLRDAGDATIIPQYISQRDPDEGVS